MADKNRVKRFKADRRRRRVRAKVHGSALVPRLTVARTLKNVIAQIIDDDRHVTLVGVSSSSKELRGGVSGTSKTAVAKQVGIEIARLAREKGIEAVVFDRNRFRYHGRVKAVADGAREGGLKF
jgi:large subunit ribosomal protein L18